MKNRGIHVLIDLFTFDVYAPNFYAVLAPPLISASSLVLAPRPYEFLYSQLLVPEEIVFALADLKIVDTWNNKETYMKTLF